MKRGKGAYVRLLTAMVFLLIAGDVVYAQGYGLRAGVNINPDQSSVGAQYELGPITNAIWLQPNLDLGFGNSTTLFATNLDVVYRRPVGRRTPWVGYLGGGPAINFYKFAAYSQTEPGVNVLGGLSHSNGLFTEIRVGFAESPQFRFGVGYAFRPKTGARTRPPARRP
jgi:hypothetical protein